MDFWGFMGILLWILEDFLRILNFLFFEWKRWWAYRRGSCCAAGCSRATACPTGCLRWPCRTPWSTTWPPKRCCCEFIWPWPKMLRPYPSSSRPSTCSSRSSIYPSIHPQSIHPSLSIQVVICCGCRDSWGFLRIFRDSFGFFGILEWFLRIFGDSLRFF